MAEDEKPSVPIKFEPELPRWAQVGLVFVLAFLCAVGFLWDQRDVGERGGLLETWALILDITLSIAGLAALINVKKIATWLVNLFVTVLVQRGLVIAAVAPRVDEFNVAAPAPEPTRKDSLTLRWQRSGRSRKLTKLEVLGGVLVQKDVGASNAGSSIFAHILLAVCLAFAIPQLFRWVDGLLPSAPAVTEITTPQRSTAGTIETCPAGCDRVEGQLSCALERGGDPTVLARALLPQSDDVTVALFADAIFELNREPLGLPNDRTIPLDTTLRIPERAGLCPQ